MKTLRLVRLALQSCVLVAVLALAPGCEDDDPNTSDLDNWFAQHPFVLNPASTTGVVTISPASATISFVGGKVVFTARGGSGSYTWDVANAAMGNVHAAGANQGVYTATSLGNNNVIVYDRSGNAAVARITGNTAALTITADPSATVSVDNGMTALSVTGGQAPYTWSVTYAARGALPSGNTGPSVVYMRYSSGDNAVTVQDGAGNTASIVISQP